MTHHSLSSEAMYSVLVGRSPLHPIADCYGFSLRDTLPSFPLPLASGENEPVINVQAIFDRIYERGHYGGRVDYSQPIPAPALAKDDEE